MLAVCILAGASIGIGLRLVDRDRDSKNLSHMNIKMGQLLTTVEAIDNQLDELNRQRAAAMASLKKDLEIMKRDLYPSSGDKETK